MGNILLLSALLMSTAAGAADIDFTAATLNRDGFREGIDQSGNAFDFSVDNADFYDTAKSDALDDKHWSVSCKKDAMTDIRICETYHDSANLFFRTSGSAKNLTLCVFHHDFPGRAAQLRIGNAKPLTSESGCFGAAASAVLARKMVPGTQIRTRYWKWPDDYPVDVDYRTTPSFNEMLAWIAFWYGDGTRKLNWAETPSAN